MAAKYDAAVEANHVEKMEHQCRFAIALIQRLVRALTPPDGTVFDPYFEVGSGICASLVEGRRGWGSEIDSAYAAIARQRDSTSLQGTLRYRQLDKPSGPLALQVHLGVLEDAGIPALLDLPPIYASPGAPHCAAMLRLRLMVPASRIDEGRRALMQARQAGGELGETARG